jgi:hypothetical protein
MTGDGHNFVVTKIGQLEKTRNSLVPEIVPPQIRKPGLLNGIPEGMDDSAACFHG